MNIDLSTQEYLLKAVEGQGDFSADPKSNSQPGVYLRDFEDAIRHTPEYRVAWDLELWRALQYKNIEKEIEQHKKKLQDKVRTSLVSQERDIKKELERAVRDLELREKGFTEEEKKQERRKTRLVEAERELDRRFQALGDTKRRVEEESEARVARIKEDYAHRSELERHRKIQLQDALAKSEERLKLSQKEYTDLWQEFNDFKSRTVSASTPETVALERLRGQHTSELFTLQERMSRESKDSLSELQRRLDSSTHEISRTSAMLAQKREMLRATQQENASLRMRLVCTEKDLERLSLDLRTNKEDKQCKVVSLATEDNPCFYATKNPSEEMTKATKIPTQQTADLYSKLQLWNSERSRLLEMSGGAYNPSSEIILTLDRKILDAQRAISEMS